MRKKESEVLEVLEGDDSVWRALARESMKSAWGKEDEIWDKVAKRVNL